MKILKVLICVIALAVFCYSGYQIYEIVHSRNVAASHYDTYSDFVEEKTEPTQAETSDKKKDNKDNKDNKDKKKNYDCNISLDFDSLKSRYPDAIGWIHFNDVNISYPVMQSHDNSFYLNRLPDGSYNSSGSIFADCRNTKPEEDKNTILYGHNMMNNTMFGSLDRYNSQEFYEENPVFYYLTPEKTYKADIIAGVMVDYKSDIYRVDLQDDRLESLVSQLVSRSTFKANKSYKTGDRIIILSTCAGSTDETRYVLIGVINE